MFTVQEFYMTQKLRGTVTYMMKVITLFIIIIIIIIFFIIIFIIIFNIIFNFYYQSDSGTAQDKIDFKLTLSPSSFICPTKLPQ